MASIIAVINSSGRPKRGALGCGCVVFHAIPVLRYAEIDCDSRMCSSTPGLEVKEFVPAMFRIT